MIMRKPFTMKKYLVITLLLALIACQKVTPEFTYAYKISVSSSIDNIDGDRKIYYYDSDSTLLRVDTYYFHGLDNSEYYVDYKDNAIYNWDGNYTLGSNGRITSVAQSNTVTVLEYEAEKITCKRKSAGTQVIEEIFYEYQNGNLIMDSTVIFSNPVNPAITVYRYEYADTLASKLMIDPSGLNQLPRKSKNLVKQARSAEHGILYKYSYEITEDELVQRSVLFDEFHNQQLETIITRYRLDTE
jgi:hypothetical protein